MLGFASQQVHLFFSSRYPRFYAALRLLAGRPFTVFTYPWDCRPRYGYGRPPHAGLTELLDKSRGGYSHWLSRFANYREDLLRIPLRDNGGPEPCWMNRMMPALDTIALYCILREYKPARYVEIGSGFSTKVAHRAIRDGNLATQIISIDPHPRAEIDGLCDHVIREAVEQSDPSLFDQLAPGDILFVDNSHCCYTNSDVCAFFLDVLPRLRPGVIVQIHDIAWPIDYPPEWKQRYYSEQYLLACCLLSAPAKYEIMLPSNYLLYDADLHCQVQQLWNTLQLANVPMEGMSLWFQVGP